MQRRHIQPLRKFLSRILILNRELLDNEEAMKKMNSKERVLTAISHKIPDRVPCNYLGTPEIDDKLISYFGVSSVDELLNCLGVDIRVIDSPYIGPELKKWPDGRFENFWGQIRKPIKNEAGSYFESVEFPYAEFKSVSDVERFRWPRPEWFDVSSISSGCDKYKDYAIIYGSPGNMDLINGISFGRGVEQFLFDIATEDPVGVACIEKRFEICYCRTEQAMKAGRGKIDILWIGDDYGSQNGLLMHPKIWRKLFFPKLKAMCDLAHQHGAKLMLHSCGSTRIIWQDFIEAGVDIYDTIQPEAAGMNPASLKAEFGDRICFHGTISTQKTLPFGTPDDVRAEVLERIATVGKGGGFVLAPAHNIQPDTPLENILAMYSCVTGKKI